MKLHDRSARPTVPPRLSFAIPAGRRESEIPMSSISCASAVRRVFAAALGAASLAACAQSSVVTQKSASLEHNRPTSDATNRSVVVTKKYDPFVSDKNGAETQV